MKTHLPTMAISLADQLKQKDAQIARLKDSLADESAGRLAAIDEASLLREQAARLVTLYAELETVKLGKALAEEDAARYQENWITVRAELEHAMREIAGLRDSLVTAGAQVNHEQA